MPSAWVPCPSLEPLGIVYLPDLPQLIRLRGDREVFDAPASQNVFGK